MRERDEEKKIRERKTEQTDLIFHKNVRECSAASSDKIQKKLEEKRDDENAVQRRANYNHTHSRGERAHPSG